MEIPVVNPIEWVRSRPQQFFSGGTPDPIQLLAYVMADVVILGGGECLIRQRNGWWIIGSNSDWIRHQNYSVVEIFDHVVAEPAHGVHSMRSEVIVKAFARDVAVKCCRNYYQIQGEMPLNKVTEATDGILYAIIFSV